MFLVTDVVHKAVCGQAGEETKKKPAVLNFSHRGRFEALFQVFYRKEDTFIQKVFSSFILRCWVFL